MVGEIENASENYPSGWAEYVSQLGETGRTPERGLAVWATRFRVARSMREVRLEGMSKSAEQGYLVGLKLTLVDTALEALESALDLRPGSITVRDPDLSFELWEDRRGELGDIYRLLKNNKLKAELESFFESDKDTCQEFDLRTILRALRHLNSHGEFTPTGSSLYTSQRYRSLMLRLADDGLKSCEEFFRNNSVSRSPLSQGTADVWREDRHDLTTRGFLRLGAIGSFSLSKDGTEMCVRFPMSVPSIHINFETLEEAPCPETHLQPDDKFIEFLPLGTSPYGDLVRQLDFSSHGTVHIWKVADLGFFLATEKELHWVEGERPVTTIPVPGRGDGVADFLRYRDLSLLPGGRSFALATDSGIMAVDISRGLASRIDFAPFHAVEHLRYSEFLDSFIVLESHGLGLSFWGNQSDSGSEPVQKVCDRFSKAPPQITWLVPVGVPESVVVTDEGTGAIITSATKPPICVSLETGDQEPWFGQAAKDLSHQLAEDVLLASGGHKSGLLRKLSFTGEVLGELTFGESPRIRVGNLSGGRALVSDAPGTVATLNVADFAIEEIRDLGLTSITAAVEVAGGDLVVAGFRGKQFCLLQLDSRNLGEKVSSNLAIGSHRAFLLADQKNARVMLFSSQTPEMLVWSGDTNGNPESIPLSAVPRCGVTSPSGNVIYLGYRDKQAIGVVNLGSLREEEPMSAPAEIQALDITQDGKSLLALGSGVTSSHLAVVAVPVP